MKQARVVRLATIDRDGYPHVVPIYFLLDGDDLVFGTDDNERKVYNARRNPKGAAVIGGDLETAEAGYLIQGDLTVENDAEHKTLRRLWKKYDDDSED